MSPQSPKRWIRMALKTQICALLRDTRVRGLIKVDPTQKAWDLGIKSLSFYSSSHL